MTELIYTEGDAPLTGPADKLSEMLPVVDNCGVVTGRCSRATAHEKCLLHPVVRLNIINRKGNIYLQKRSQNKDLYPGLWDSAAAGHVGYGEHLCEAIMRESAEELGLTDFNPLLMDTYLYDNQKEKELVAEYAAVGNFKLDPHNAEVECGAWWTPKDIDESIGKGVFTATFEYDWKQYKDKLRSLL